MFLRIVQVVLIFCICLFYGFLGYADATPTEIQPSFASLQEPHANWGGARSGPSGRVNALVAIVSEDLRNGGILGVTQGIKEATEIMGWRTRIFDAAGTANGRDKALEVALAMKPDGMILVGSDARSLNSKLEPFAKQGIPMVGWHVTHKPGVLIDSMIAMNVSTDPLEVARLTAIAVVADAQSPVGVVIFTDSNFEIAMSKANAMAAIVQSCKVCTLLEVRDVAISTVADTMPAVTQELLKRYGMRWTHALAINDIYFDYAVPELIKAGRANESLSLLSAGDGYTAAFLRIRAGAFQTATVAEPLNLQGWQLVDELNRLIAGEPVTGYVIPPHLVTAKNISFDGTPRMFYEPDYDYRSIYRNIWKR